MLKLEDKQKGVLLSLCGILIITPDSLFIRLSNINSWDLVFYRGIIPFVLLFLGLVIYYKKNFLKIFMAIGIAGVLNALIVALTNITFVMSLENTNVANTLIMLTLAPFIAALLSMFFLNEFPNKMISISMVLGSFFPLGNFLPNILSMSWIWSKNSNGDSVVSNSTIILIKEGWSWLYNGSEL